MSCIVGLTGPSGAGKSMASSCAESLGFFVIDCDKTARMAVLPGSAGLMALEKVFGRGILNSDGSLNRRALAAAAFSSREKTQLLNETLLPHIVALIRPELERPLVLLDAPTLYESGLDKQCKTTVAVLAERSLRLSRITARDGITIKDAELRLSAGKADAFYLERADKVLYNNGAAAEFLRSAEELFKSIIGGNNDE